jgi:leucyl-tRNA---protein transferase
MFAKARAPESLTPTDLDAYLDQGWYRMGQGIFTTNFIHFKSEMYSTVWLRVLLDEFLEEGTQKKLFKRNAGFQVAIRPANLTDEKEELYARYKQSLSFNPSDSLRSLLFSAASADSIYNTYEVTVHDGDWLIAVGFFDLGETSAAGISSVYDPAYKKYSLGKYLIYLKMQYCKNQKMRYFYPGYFVPGYSFFDYKLTIARPALQFLQLSSQQWLPIETFSPENIPYQIMHHKLIGVQKLLMQRQCESRVVKYEFFDANLIPDLRDAQLVDFPVFLFCPYASQDGINPVLVFDARDGCYHLLVCFPYWKPDETNPDTEFYSAYFLKSLQEIYITASTEEMAEVFLKVLTTKPDQMN